jgi:hypothetical protein
MSLILRQIFVGNSKITGSLPNPHYSPIGNLKSKNKFCRIYALTREIQYVLKNLYNT